MRITFVTATGRTHVDHKGNDIEQIRAKMDEYTTMIRTNSYMIIDNGEGSITTVNPHAVNEIIGEPYVIRDTQS